jgi:hypothetical protein
VEDLAVEALWVERLFGTKVLADAAQKLRIGVAESPQQAAAGWAYQSVPEEGRRFGLLGTSEQREHHGERARERGGSTRESSEVLLREEQWLGRIRPALREPTEEELLGRSPRNSILPLTGREDEPREERRGLGCDGTGSAESYAALLVQRLQEWNLPLAPSLGERALEILEWVRRFPPNIRPEAATRAISSKRLGEMGFRPPAMSTWKRRSMFASAGMRRPVATSRR